MPVTNEVDPLDDPVIRLVATGQAKSLDEAEEMHLNQSMPEILALIGSSLSRDELIRHPLIQLLLRRGMRGREDSIW
jgi:hypothetical protein